jgi:surfeit locus 1 family protein
VKPLLKKWLLIVSSLLMIAITTSLGFWQLRRAAEKLQLQSVQGAQASKTMVTTSQLREASTVAPLLHQRVRLRGVWAGASTVYLDNRQMDNKVGFFVFTPLLLEGGGSVVVQRGWAPRNFTERTRLPPVQTPEGLVEIEGRIALPPSKLYELGTAATGTIRLNLDLEHYRKETGLPLMELSIMQTGAASQGLLRDWPAVNLGVAKHQGYAFQWFALAGLLLLLLLWFQLMQPYYQRRKKQNHSHS